MKQFLSLHPSLVVTLATQLVALLFLLCQVQGGIITNQESLALPKELADSIAAASDPATEKNGTRSGRVLYTAPYSNVRISSKEPKSLKYFPIPAVISKKHIPSPTMIVPVLRTSTAESTTTTTASSTTTTTTPQPPSTSAAAPVHETIPDIIEILEEIEPDSDDGEVVTETFSNAGDFSNNNDADDNEDVAVTETNLEDE